MRLTARIGQRELEIELDATALASGTATVSVDGEALEVDLRPVRGETWSLLLGPRSHELSIERRTEGWLVRGESGEALVRLHDPDRAPLGRADRTGGHEHVTAVMPGRVVRLLVEPGQEVERDGALLVVEAMKMENEITSPRAGLVRAVRVSAGQTVETGAVLVEIE